MAIAYVRGGGTAIGNQGIDTNGGSWSQAYGQLSTAEANVLRGDTIYVSSGTYGSVTFDMAVSGTTLVTVKGATVADHGTPTGWSAALSVSTSEGGSQATFTGMTFNSSYWVVDSQVYSPTPAHSTARTSTSYGFTLSGVDGMVLINNTTTNLTTITLTGFYANNTSGADVNKLWLVTGGDTDSNNRNYDFITVSHCYFIGWTNVIHATNNGLTNSDWLSEYNLVMNGVSTATWHGEDFNNNYANMVRWTIRYNWFEGRGAGTATIVALNGDVTSYLIYGNVFKSQTSGDGTVTGVINASTQELRGIVYNNTFIQNSGGGWIGTAVLSTVRNNIVYNQSAAIGAGTASSSVQYTGYWDTTDTPSVVTEVTRYVGSGSPFINVGANDLALTSAAASAMDAGVDLGSPYNVDMFGNTRGAGGKWDRGAFEFVEGGSPASSIPFVSLRAVQMVEVLLPLVVLVMGEL